MSTHQTAKTQFLKRPNGERFAYRRLGATWGIPLLMLIHYRGTMDFWDPLVVNGLAEQRPVILMDYSGVGFSTGRVASTVADSADDVLQFIRILGESELDILGFSIGGYIAPMVALNAPEDITVRKLVISGTGPSGGPDTVINSPSHQDRLNSLASGPDLTLDDFATLFFPQDLHGETALNSWFTRIYERNISTSGEERSNWLSFNFTDGGKGVAAQSNLAASWLLINETRGRNGSYDRLPGLKTPVLITNGNVGIHQSNPA